MGGRHIKVLGLALILDESERGLQALAAVKFMLTFGFFFFMCDFIAQLRSALEQKVLVVSTVVLS